MIHYVLTFADEAAAKADAEVGKYWTVGEEKDAGSWRTDICIPSQQITIRGTGTEPVLDAQGEVVTPGTPQEHLPGWHIGISLTTPSDALLNHPNLMAAFDRDAAASGGRFIVGSAYKAENLIDLQFTAFMGDATPERMRAAPAKDAGTRTKTDWVADRLKSGGRVGTKIVATRSDQK